MSTYSIGYFRDDGDFALLATVNNNDGHLAKSDLDNVIETIKNAFGWIDEKIIHLERQDAPDYITIDEEC